MTEPAAKKPKVIERDSDIIISKVQWATIFTDSTKESAAFYEKFLGWKIPADCEKYMEQWAEVRNPNDINAQAPKDTAIAFHTSKGENSSVAGTLSLNLLVKDLEKFHEHVKSIEGLKVISPPNKPHWGGYIANYEGPDGVQISVLQEWQAAPKTEEKKEDEPISGRGVCHLEIPCESFDRVRKFFTDTFGWTFTVWGDDDWFWVSNDPKYKLSGGLVASKERIAHPVLYLNAGPIDVALEKIKANGGKVIKEKYSVRPHLPKKGAAHFADTEGNVWALYYDEEAK